MEKPTTETIHFFLPRRKQYKQNQRRKPVLKTQKQRAIARYILKCWILLRRQNPPKSSDGNHKTKFSYHDGNHNKQKTTTETIKRKRNNSCDDGNHKKKTNDRNHKRKHWMMSTTETIKKKRPDGFRDELCIYIYIYRERERDVMYLIHTT